MSTILDMARGIAAILAPLVGTRATGIVHMHASGADVTVPRNTYLVPVIEGRERPDLAFKALEGPNTDKSWTVTAAGTDVSATSNLGGQRHNVDIDTDFHVDPPIITGIASAKAKAAFAGGADLTSYGALKDVAIVEQALGAQAGQDIRRSLTKGFPCVLMWWVEGEPADGGSSDMTTRRTRGGTSSVLYKEQFALTLIASRGEASHSRREEGLYILDQIRGLLTDRRNIDGYPISNPSGIQIVRSWRETGRDDFYKAFYAYNLTVACEGALSQIDARTYNDLDHFKVDVFKPQVPPLPNQGDTTLVDDMEMDNT